MMEIISKTLCDECGNLLFDVTIRKDGEVMHKLLDAEDYLQMFRESVDKKKELVRIPRLPATVVGAKVDPERQDTFEALVKYPPERRAFKYMGQHMILPFPALLAKVEVEKGVRKETCLYALGEDWESEEPTLYRYPYGNVGNVGHCCYGNIVCDGIRDVTLAPSVLDMFLYGETNNDLWGSDKVKGAKEKGISSQSDLIETVRDMETYPVDWLVKSGSALKF